MQLCLALRAALALAALSCSCRAAAAVVAAEPRRGIWAYFCYSDTASIAGSSPPGHYTRRCWDEQSVEVPAAVQGTLMMVKWRHVEPSSGVYDWSALDANISKAVALDLQLLIAIEICKADPKDEATPDWLYEAVPGVNFTHSPKGVVVPYNTTNPHRCPNYRDPRFQSVFGRLIKALATHLAGLPPPEKQLVVGVQAMLGITGDDRPWNGNPIDPKLWITDAQWTAYTRKMSLEYCAAFSAVGMRVLFNLENPGVGGHDVEDPHVPMRCLLCWHPAVK